MAAERAGFTKVPLRCLHCGRKFPSSVVITHGAVLRCDGCRTHQYALPVLHVGLMFVATITREDALWLTQRGATPSEVLEHLGVIAKGAA